MGNARNRNGLHPLRLMLTLRPPAPIVLPTAGVASRSLEAAPETAGERVQMARHRAGKAKAKDVPAREGGRRGKAKANASESALQERLAAIERERDALRAALEAEQTRRRRLEEVHAAARDRIAWALDSLQSILDPKA